ncbi:hypothetical protein VC83_09177 [Pseudogymnoascus destructans]|uniref:Uncharacterized protein n=1 Tax=Pseudogymnoascus destructans TaxID=655981 RepID=A0A176ZX93_9PEZI|nr:uncharacterized protein VC83_09177 [Pseudogymnoascus destructans]OAF54546.1 hypothetical protein VC83_09177 [Pseudogymnoascus destructans]
MSFRYHRKTTVLVRVRIALFIPPPHPTYHHPPGKSPCNFTVAYLAPRRQLPRRRWRTHPTSLSLSPPEWVEFLSFPRQSQLHRNLPLLLDSLDQSDYAAYNDQVFYIIPKIVSLESRKRRGLVDPASPTPTPRLKVCPPDNQLRVVGADADAIGG